MEKEKESEKGFEPSEELKERMRRKANYNVKNTPNIKTSTTLGDRIRAVLPVLSAVTNGKEIDLKRREERLKICSECEFLSVVNGYIGCGVCSCRLHIGDKSVLNLISLEETDKYGCKYPEEKGGSRWRKNGV